MYGYLVRRYLQSEPDPDKFKVQAHLAKELETLSPAYVSNERKALAGFFRFLHEEGLWHHDPLQGIKHIRVRYRERQCPEVDDVMKLLEVGCRRMKDAAKLRLLVLLIVTTGVRISEAASVLKERVDYTRLEMQVRGKGDRFRVVPLAPPRQLPSGTI